MYDPLTPPAYYVRSADPHRVLCTIRRHLQTMYRPLRIIYYPQTPQRTMYDPQTSPRRTMHYLPTPTRTMFHQHPVYNVRSADRTVYYVVRAGGTFPGSREITNPSVLVGNCMWLRVSVLKF